MRVNGRKVAFAAWLATGAVLAAQARAGTFSVEGVAINGVALPSPQSVVDAQPGDRLTIDVFVRDWSTSGERLRGYQVVFDFQSFAFSPGNQGRIRPVDFATTTDVNAFCTKGGAVGVSNGANAFVTASRPDYVFFGGSPVNVVDTLSCGYRYASLIQGMGVLSSPGVKKYLATLNVEVSADAQGTFVIRLDETPVTGSVLRQATGIAINPTFETLTINVPDDSLEIVSSVPPDGAIDARQPSNIDGSSPTGVSQIDITFNGDASALGAGDFSVSMSPAGTPPSINGVVAAGNTVTLQLSGPIVPGHWTIFTHDASGTSTTIGYLPADVNGDGTSSSVDILAIVDALNGVQVFPIMQTDVDRSGQANSADIIRVVDLLNGAQAFDVWNNRSLP